MMQAGQQPPSALMVSPGWAELLRPLHSCIEDSLDMGSFGRGVIWALPAPETPQDSPSQYLGNSSREGVLGTHYNLGDRAKLLSEEELDLKLELDHLNPLLIIFQGFSVPGR